jgi:hypothetical protein
VESEYRKGYVYIQKIFAGTIAEPFTSIMFHSPFKDDKEAVSLVEPQDDIANATPAMQIENNTFFIVILFKLNIGANIDKK